MPDQTNKSIAASQRSETAPGYQLAIRRDGGRVTIVLTAASDYSAMQLYDTLVKAAGQGAIHLDLASG